MSMKKIIPVCFVLSVAVLVLLHKEQSYSMENNSTIGTNNLISIMIKDSNGEYQKSTTDTFPVGMSLNEELSYCLNGTEIGYDSLLGNVSITGIGSDECYIYFDMEVLGRLILDHNGGVDAIESKEVPNFSTIADTDEGMYSAEDNYGTSYYFRGAVDNNWVEFGGFYWRIIRVNGDGSVRMIYSGEVAPTEEEKVTMLGTKTAIGTSAFNVYNMLIEYSGYVYTIGAGHGNSEDSSIKSVIDDWYVQNLSDYEKYISDSIFCTDRTTQSNVEVFGTNVVIFSGSSRLLTNKNPSIICSNKLDSLTVGETDNSTNSLDYPIGLLSADEGSLAGGVISIENSSYYLYTNINYWLSTPFQFSSNVIANNFVLYNTGNLTDYYVDQVNNVNNIRPVINLKSDVNVTGTGEWDNPYIIVTN